MKVVCPACSKQHHVKDQMAGKRAKCSCGEVITIPAAPVPEPATDDWLHESYVAVDPLTGAAPGPTTGVASPNSAGVVLFQCDYGMVRRSMWWLFGANFVIALVLIPTGIFWNDGWAINNAPLPPWAATLLFESVAVCQLALVAYMIGGYFLNGRRHQRVAVTASGVILPKSKLSTEELFIPWAQVRVKHWGGPVEHLYFKRGTLKTSQLSSVQFPTDDDFATFFDHLRQQGKVG